jgi:hypothetical protein
LFETPPNIKEDLIMIELKPISILDKEMAECINLRVTEEQDDFVASNSYSLAEAYDTNEKICRKGLWQSCRPICGI